MADLDFQFSPAERELLASLQNEGKLPQSFETDTLVESGTQVGHFRLIARLGVGHNSTVYLGEHMEIGKRVAIKVSQKTASAWRRFLREARFIGRLQHPNIVDLYDFLQHPQLGYCLVMELLEGESLRARLKHGAISPYSAALISWHILEGLSAIHRIGLLHRDINPSNIFLHRWGRRSIVKLIDFGSIKQEGEITSSGLVSTRWYAAPEVQDKEETDTRADLYSVGVVLYEMLSGRNASRLFASQVPGDFIPPARLCPNLPKALEEILLSCLSSDPIKRPVSSNFLQDSLQALLPTLPCVPLVETISELPEETVSIMKGRVSLEERLFTPSEIG